MEPDEFRKALLGSATGVLSLVRVLLRVLPRRVTPDQWTSFVQALYPQVMSARQQSFIAGRDFYLAQRRQQGVTSQPPQIIERSYPVERLEKALEPARLRLVVDEELAAEQRAIAEREIAAKVERHVMAAGRNAIEDGTNHDPDALGWARVPSGAETCAFCTMLTSRGPVYKSRASATERADGEPYHDRCDCVPAPVFDRNNWPGRDEYVAAKALWKQHPSLNELRTHYAAQSGS